MGAAASAQFGPTLDLAASKPSDGSDLQTLEAALESAADPGELGETGEAQDAEVQHHGPAAPKQSCGLVALQELGFACGTAQERWRGVREASVGGNGQESRRFAHCVVARGLQFGMLR